MWGRKKNQVAKNLVKKNKEKEKIQLSSHITRHHSSILFSAELGLDQPGARVQFVALFSALKLVSLFSFGIDFNFPDADCWCWWPAPARLTRTIILAKELSAGQQSPSRLLFDICIRILMCVYG